MKFTKQLTAATALACSVSTAALADAEDNTLTVAVAKEIQTLDGLYSTRRENIILNYLTSDQLVVFDPNEGAFKPALASSFEFVSDTQIDFVLRDGVTFHDGSPVTVDDIIYSFNWTASDESKSRNTAVVARWFDRIEATGENRFSVHMKHPYPLALNEIETRFLIRKDGAYAGDPDALSQQMVGTGPYRVTDFDMSSGVTLERYDDYYAGGGKNPGEIDEITFRHIPEWGTITAEMMAGGVDFAYDAPDDIASELAQVPFLDLQAGPSMRIAFIILDAQGASGEDNPMTNLLVRQALNHAVNREAIVEYLVGGTGQVIDSGCAPIQFGCEQDVTSYSYDPDRAKELLAEAGYADGFEFDLWSYRDKNIAEAVAADLARIGVIANINYVKLSALTSARANNEIMAYHGTWASYSIQDVGAISNHYVNSSNRAMHGNDRVSELFESAQQSLDPAAREASYSEALKTFADNAYWIPLYQFTQNYLAREGLQFEPASDELVRLNEYSWSD